MKYILSTLFAILLSLSSNALASNFEIVAIVNDTAISTMDLNERLDLSISSSGLKDDSLTRDKLKPQILRTLIDEALYMQEARELRIDASSLELKKAIVKLEKQNKLKQGTFDDFLKKNGIPVQAMKKQIESQVIWGKILNKRVRPKIIITEREIEEKLEHISNVSGISELDISEIVLHVDSPVDAKRIKSLAEKLYDEIKEGANFESIAKEFSQSSTASNGGSLGWVREEHAPKEIISKIRNLQVGGISLPFYENGNYYIIKLNDRRALINDPSTVKKVKLKHAFVEIANNLPKSEVIKMQDKIRASVVKYKSCADFAKLAKNINSKLSTETISIDISELNPEVKPAVIQTPVNSLTPPIPSPGGIHIFGVCDKTEPEKSIVLKDRIEGMILRRKIDLQAQRYLQKLRDKAFIEIRI